MLGRLHFVTGKGGVGKSTVAAALALGLSERGTRVLAIELSPPAGLSRLLGVRPTEPSQQVPVREGLWLTYFDGEAALAEYLRKRVRLGGLLDAVLAHPLYKAFVGSAPGLRELMAVGKIRDELRQKDGLRHRWDAIVIDAGASGHALEHLRMPAAAAATFPAGLVHRESQRNVALLSDPEHTAVHVVALPEEMPLKEAAEVVERLQALDLPVGHLVVNRCREPSPPGLDAALRSLAGLELEGDESRAREAVRTVADRALGWLLIQQRGIAELERRTGRRSLRLPLLATPSLDRDDLARFGATLLGEAP